MIKKFLEKVGEYFLFLKKVFKRPERFSLYWKQFILESDKLIVSSVLIVAVISVFIGGVLVIQTASNLENPFIDKMYVGYMVRESLILEFCSTMIALILAGKIGSNIASELGSMRITEQIDAMETMGVNSANYLILPKIVAFMAMMPFLVIISVGSALIGGYAMAFFTDILTVDEYVYGITYAFVERHVPYAIIKSVIYAFVISSMSSYYGYYTKGGALEVGKASTNAVVRSSVVILFLDIFLTKLMLS